jgi:hypothetical protein
MVEENFKLITKKTEKNLEKLQKRLEENKNKIKILKNNYKNVDDVNKTLSKNYQTSIKIIIDVSNLLDKYAKIFQTIEEIMKDLENTFKIKERDFTYIKNLTTSSALDIKVKMDSEIDKVINILDKKGYKQKANEYRKFKENNLDLILISKKLKEENDKKKKLNKINLKIAEPITPLLNSLQSQKLNNSNKSSNSKKLNSTKIVYAKPVSNTTQQKSQQQQPKEKTLTQRFYDILYT